MRGTSVLFCGDVNVDIVMGGLPGPVELDREILSSGFDVVLGSSAAITACAHARLGGSTVFAGLGGQDAYGAMMRTWLEEAGANTRHLVLSPEQRTGVTVNILQPAGRYQVTYPGAIPRFVPNVPAILADTAIGHVHFSGVYLQTDLLPQLAHILEALTAQGVTSSIDPQWDSSGTWAGLDTWVRRVSILFCNEDEACSLTRKDQPLAALAVLGERCPTVVLKLGAQGVMVKTPQGQWTQKGLQVSVKDCIGAGDNLAAGYLYATLTAGMSTPAALAFANAAGARSCQFSGGTAARSTYHDVLKLLETNA